MRTKKKDYEKLTDANISHVIELLEAEKPITKKEACNILNITYNTTRLANIIKEYRETQNFRAQRRAEKKGTGATREEIKAVVQGYIDGENVSEIASDLYRSPAFVRGIIERLGIPKKCPTDGYNWKEIELPEQCVAERFAVGEKVWCVINNTPAIIQREWVNPDGQYGYLVYTIEPPFDFTDTFFPYVKHGGRYRNCLACNLGSLGHLQDYL
jgi:hypothetical protein